MPKPPQTTRRVPVTERALLQRINRKLKTDDERVMTCRESSRAYQELGRYYTVDVRRNAITGKDLNLETVGRELKVLADWEQLA